MHRLMLILILIAAQADPAQPAAAGAQGDPQSAQSQVRPLEEVLKTAKSPNGKHIKVLLHIEVLHPNYRRAMHVKFIDVRPSPAVNIKCWDPKLRSLKRGTVLTVVGDLHYGAVSGRTKSIRYKVREISGRRYRDNRHWRTDRAIYITNPTWKIRLLPWEEILTQRQRDVLAGARKKAAGADTPKKKQEILAAARKKVAKMMVGGQMNLLRKFAAARLALADREALEKVLTDDQKKVLVDARKAAADTPKKKQQLLSAAREKVAGMLTDDQKIRLEKLVKDPVRSQKSAAVR
jgi:hypothetical protein